METSIKKSIKCSGEIYSSEDFLCTDTTAGEMPRNQVLSGKNILQEQFEAFEETDEICERNLTSFYQSVRNEDID